MERTQMDYLQDVGVKALALLLVFLSPIAPVMAATGALIGIDTITGVWAARKEKQPITSHRLKRVVGKSAAYLLAIFTAFLVEKYMLGEAVPIIKTVSGAVALVEGKSILENLKRITGIDLWKALVDKLQGSNIKVPDELK